MSKKRRRCRRQAKSHSLLGAFASLRRHRFKNWAAQGASGTLRRRLCRHWRRRHRFSSAMQRISLRTSVQTTAALCQSSKAQPYFVRRLNWPNANNLFYSYDSKSLLYATFDKLAVQAHLYRLNVVPGFVLVPLHCLDGQRPNINVVQSQT